MKTNLFPRWISLVTVFAMLLMAGTVLAGDEIMVDGVLNIANAGTSSQGLEIIDLEEVWRVGGEDGDDFFGLVSQVLVGQDGSIYLLDTRLSEVPVYSPEGERVDTLSREGEGPGETRMPSNLVMMPNGNLGLVQRFPGRITMIDLQGNPQGEVKPKLEDGGYMALFDCFPNGQGKLTVTGQAFKQDGATGRINNNFVANFDMEGNEVVRFTEVIETLDFSNFHYKEDEDNKIDFRKAIVGPDGRVYVSKKRNSYEIEVYKPEGGLDRIIQREYEHRKRSDEENQLVNDTAERNLSRMPGAKFEMSKIHPDISSLQFGSDGNLWVTSSRSGFEQSEGILLTYDVFNPDGHFIKQISTRCDGDGEKDTLFWSQSGSAVLVTGFADALMSLQTGGNSGSDEDEEAAPMEVVYLKMVK